MTETKRNKTTTISTKLIAPCGMNCRLCLGYIREKKRIRAQVAGLSIIKTAKNQNTVIDVG
jgi:hypothetical protein